MHLEPFKVLSWAYQLHYYLCFRSHRRRLHFGEVERADRLSHWLGEICQHHDYHLLQSKPYADHLRCLLSLRPDQNISTVVQTLKSDLSRELGAEFQLGPPMWARGYLARTIGRVRLDAVKRYIYNQSEHHGYDTRLRPPIFRYRTRTPLTLTAARGKFELNYHLVFATRFRRAVFDSKSGEGLGDYWLKVADKRGFAIDQITILPDHVHLLVRTVPRMSVENCALSLLNNGQHWVGQHVGDVLVHEGIDQLWQASAYVGTCGKATTALVKWFLSQDD